MAITDCALLVPQMHFILIQTVIFIPLVLIRNLSRLSGVALLADAFIVAALGYTVWCEVGIIAERGIAEVKLFNASQFPLFIG